MPEGVNNNLEPKAEHPKELDLHIAKKILYHGSGKPGIIHLDVAEEATIGAGVYFTTEEKDASGYAKRRARNRNGSPVVYKAEIENLRLVNLTTDENVTKILEGFKPILQKKMEASDKWHQQEAIRKALSTINEGAANAENLRAATFSNAKLFSDYLSSLGYDGLVALEGGEGDDIKNHDSYVIFNTEKIKLLEEKSI